LRAARYLGLIKKIFQNLIKKMNYMHLSYCKIDKNGMRFVAITSSHVNCIPFHQQESDDGHERDELCLRKHERNVTRGGNKWAIEGPLYVVLETLSLVCVSLCVSLTGYIIVFAQEPVHTWSWPTKSTLLFFFFYY
jgi:hypothetical protein